MGYAPLKLPDYYSGKGVLKRGVASLTKPIPPLLIKERGIKGVRLLSDLVG